MTCRYCGYSNIEDDHRCVRCGRRLRMAPPRPVPDTYPLSETAGALATALQPQALASFGESDETLGPVLRQGRLFSTVEPSKVVAIRREKPMPPPPSARGSRRTQGPATSSAVQQGAFDFQPAGPRTMRTLKTTVEASIYCDAPVATPTHRILAAALDISVVLIAAAVFLLTFYFMGGHVDPSLKGLSYLLPAIAFVFLFYGLIWPILGRETPGMRWTGLQLVNFDGYPPEPRQRAVRFAGICLSCGASGLGLLWALVDEENLTWHDHMSQTFPTVRHSLSSSFRRG